MDIYKAIFYAAYEEIQDIEVARRIALKAANKIKTNPTENEECPICGNYVSESGHVEACRHEPEERAARIDIGRRFSSPQKPGDLCIGMKWGDGDPQEHFVVGDFHGMTDHKDARYLITDAAGQQFRHNGFRTAVAVSPEIGNWIVENMPAIEQSGKSVWFWIATAEKEVRHASEN